MEKDALTFEKTRIVLEEYAQYLSDHYKERLTASDRIASGDLINSVTTEVTVNGRVMQVELSLAEYWKYVEWDTKPHTPPIAPLIRWVKLKPVVPRPYNGRLPTETQLAYMVRAKITREGTTGSHDMMDSLEETNQAFMDRLTTAVAEDIGSEVQSYMVMLQLSRD